MDYSQYLSPEDAQKLAMMGNPQDQMDALLPMQQLANQTGGIKRLGEYGNGRVIGANSGLEALGGIAQNAMGAYMQKDLANKYSDILKQGNANRGQAAGMLVNALRNAKNPQMPGATSISGNDYPVDANGMMQFDY